MQKVQKENHLEMLNTIKERRGGSHKQSNFF